MSVNLRALIDKLNNETRGAIEGAAGLCLSRTHYDVEVEHYVSKLLDVKGGDLELIVQHFGVDRARLAQQLQKALDSLKTGNARTPALSPQLVHMLTEAWTIGSVDFGADRIRSAHTVLALLATDNLRRVASDTMPELAKIKTEALRDVLPGLVSSSIEEPRGAARAGAGPARHGAAADGDSPNLDKYTFDLTQRARDGELDPVLGRDFEIRQAVDILTRRRQNNPILVGEAGVGKTAVVEGMAMRVAAGDVPEVLRHVSIRALDLALLQAGAGVKGEFENRLKGLIEEVKSSSTPVILFIDEAHTMIGAGGQAGQGDAANLLKPALARGELRTIAATTWSEYKKYFEKDPALTRRFQTVKVEEPSEEQCMVMVRGVVPSLERHHAVRILEDGVEAAVRLSHRYLPDRHLPDKAVSVLDTACARLALGQSSTPASLEYAQRRLDDVRVQTRVLSREAATGADHSERLQSLEAERTEIESRIAALEERWEQERTLVDRIREVRAGLERGGRETEADRTREAAAEAGSAQQNGTGEEPAESEGETFSREGNGSAAPAPDADALRAELKDLMTELDRLQGEDPLVKVVVDSELVGQVISGWTGIPVGKMLRDDVQTALRLEELLGERVIGQDHALETISHRIRTSRAGIEDPNKPKGVFLLVGPSGVGKTETALALADLLYGGEDNVVTINMSEFQEAHTVSTLKGSPPGYVGYGEGGVLTEAVRRRPYSVVLLDEIEKAHPDVLELFFQVFDKGRMEDGEGREIDFKNTIIILTSNEGTDTLMSLCADEETMPSPKGLVEALKPELDKAFKPAFLGRTVIIPFFPLRDEALRKIIDLKVSKVRRRLESTHGVRLILGEEVLQEIANRCTEVESGARNVDNILTNTVLPAVSRMLLESLVEDRRPERIHVECDDTGEFLYQADPLPDSASPEDAQAGASS